jgi:hypothetical protein
MPSLPNTIIVSASVTAGRTLYINLENNQVLDSRDFSPAALRAIAADIESQVGRAVPSAPSAPSAKSAQSDASAVCATH